MHQKDSELDSFLRENGLSVYQHRLQEQGFRSIDEVLWSLTQLLESTDEDLMHMGFLIAHKIHLRRALKKHASKDMFSSPLGSFILT